MIAPEDNKLGSPLYRSLKSITPVVSGFNGIDIKKNICRCSPEKCYDRFDQIPISATVGDKKSFASRWHKNVLPLFELARVLVRLDHITFFIINTNDGVM